MLSFTTHFWGEKNNGFDVLYQNMKAGQVSSRELEEYLRESCAVEESYVKLQMKLAKMAANYGNRGSFGPFWQVLRVLSEKLSTIHQQLSQSWQELIKDIHKYSIEQQRKHKEIKDKEGTTVEAVQNLQHTLISLPKAKDLYHSRYYELEKLRRESGSHKDLEKAEGKLKKSNEEYKALLDKYTKSRNEYVDHMTESCQRFQEIEEKHIQQMKEFIDVFSRARETHCNMLAEVQEQFKNGCSELTIQRLVDMIVQSKATGIDKPGTIEFIEPDASNMSTAVSTLDIDKKEHRNQIGVGILSIPKIVRTQRRKARESGDKDKEANKSDASKMSHLVDEEGFSIIPDSARNSRNSCDSSSDNDSDVEKISRLRVEIKPKTESPATGLEDIKNIVQTLKLNEFPSRRTPVNEFRSSGQSLEGTPTKPSDDLINLDIMAPPVPSTNQNQVSLGPAPSAQLDSFPSTSSSSSLSSVPATAAVDRESPFSPKSTQSSNQPPLVPPPIPRSHSRAHQSPFNATSRPAGRQTPDVFRLLSSTDRSDSTISLNSVFSSSTHPNITTPSFHSMPGYISRGPSPLTLAMSDTVPVAVAFSEVVDAVFKGADPKNFKTRILGTVFISFPGGIMRVFLDNPNPPTLSFTIKNTSRIENVIIKNPLLSEAESLSTEDSRSFTFNMPSIIDHLRKLADNNKSAKYFNVDILKYQVKVNNRTIDQLPLRLTSYWKSEPTQFDYRLDYTYQGSSMFPPSSALSNIQVALQLPTGVEDAKMHSIPVGNWLKENRRVTWKLPDLSDMSELGSSGNVKAKFDATSPTSLSKSSQSSSSPPQSSSSSSTLLSNVAFLCEGATMSGLEFELTSSGYRISLVKKRFSTGTYLSRPEIINSPSGNSSPQS